MICRFRNGAGIKNYNICMCRRIDGIEAPFGELAHDGSAICLRGTATKVLQKKSRHTEDYNLSVLRLTRSSQPLLVAAASH
jgi:hypothetical protein